MPQRLYDVPSISGWATAVFVLVVGQGCVIHQGPSTGAATARDDSLVEVGAGSDDDGDQRAAMVSSLPDGFVVKSTRTAVIQPDALKEPVRYESDWAKSTFESALEQRKDHGDAVRGTSTGGLPLLWGTEERSVLSDNAYFNEQVGHADQDRDRAISNEEARRYSDAAARLATR